MTVTPYKNDKSKREQVETMFDNIAPKYDFLNRVLSLGIDIIWRKKAIKKLKADSPKLILDIATGTGDFALEALSLNPDKIIGVDISEGMLEMGRKKMAAKNLSHKIELVKGDSEKLNFNDNTFDAVTVAFGVRNFENLEKGLADIYRVLKPNGKLVVLEFSNPKKFPIKQFYKFYSSKILPKIGNSISKDKSAYTYLPESVEAFPDGANFTNVMQKVSFTATSVTSLSGGIASIYTGKK
ncbi:MAG: bifunctional demethylmenaquinone methyltransferase/2-methoxy-6-polyprenyl-1,4-benzoquinol methylase UbiE [Bacteroidota bacterium]